MSYVIKLIEEGEHQRQDFKLRIDSSRKIAKTLVAFANSNGGRLLIGVKDNGSISGAKVHEEIHMIEAAAEMYSRPVIDYTADVWHYDNKRILQIEIEASDNRPHFAEVEVDQWECFYRSEDKNLKANGVLRKVWENEKKFREAEFHYDKEKEKLFRYMNRKGAIAFKTVSKITKLSYDETEDLLSNLILWDVVEMIRDKNRTIYQLRDESDED